MRKLDVRLFLVIAAALLCILGPGAAFCQSGPEISTEDLTGVLLSGKARVFDVRPADEYAVAHIPGSTNIYENELQRMIELCPEKQSEIVLYCNGPYCHKSIRVAEQLIGKGYTDVKRYQSGMPVWRAFGNTAETGLAGFKYVYAKDKTAVFVDARPKAEFEKGSLAGAVNLKQGEEEQANKDGRLPYHDHGTRVIVFADTPAKARVLAQEIAKRAYWNTSYFSGSFEELKQAGIR